MRHQSPQLASMKRKNRNNHSLGRVLSVGGVLSLAGINISNLKLKTELAWKIHRSAFEIRKTDLVAVVLVVVPVPPPYLDVIPWTKPWMPSANLSHWWNRMLNLNAAWPTATAATAAPAAPAVLAALAASAASATPARPATPATPARPAALPTAANVEIASSLSTNQKVMLALTQRPASPGAPARPVAPPTAANAKKRASTLSTNQQVVLAMTQRPESPAVPAKLARPAAPPTAANAKKRASSLSTNQKVMLALTRRQPLKKATLHGSENSNHLRDLSKIKRRTNISLPQPNRKRLFFSHLKLKVALIRIG